jgi:hypothetical protein
VKSRTHAITFRLGEEEYQELVGTVSSCGARSISDFSRAAVLNKVSAEQLSKFFEEEAGTLAVRLESFDSKLREVRRHVRQLASSTLATGRGKSIAD